VGPRAGLDRCGKTRLLPGFDPRTVQPVASRYTDYANRPTILCCAFEDIKEKLLSFEDCQIFSIAILIRVSLKLRVSAELCSDDIDGAKPNYSRSNSVHHKSYLELSGVELESLR
jgi:hypothetical protein